MGIVILDETRKAELEDLRQMLLSCAALQTRKDGDGFKRLDEDSIADGDGGDAQDRMVCVTSGLSYVGIAVVNQLLVSGYSVRIIVDSEEDVEKLREMEISGEMRMNNTSTVEVVMAKLMQLESLTEAFNGCHAVFHTAAFVDPSGLSGYTKVMASVEVNATKNVMTACRVSPTVTHCLLTSSLLACIWHDEPPVDAPLVIDHNSWSDESVCISKKLWYALGKLGGEKAAWEMAKNSNIKLGTICPGLITGPQSYNKNPTSTIAFLKGVKEMYANGTLATVDITNLAKAHVRIFEEMKKSASGRYICYDCVIRTEDEMQMLASETGLNASSIIGGVSLSNRPRFELSNGKLTGLMLRARRCLNE